MGIPFTRLCSVLKQERANQFHSITYCKKCEGIIHEMTAQQKPLLACCFFFVFFAACRCTCSYRSVHGHMSHCLQVFFLLLFFAQPTEFPKRFIITCRITGATHPFPTDATDASLASPFVNTLDISCVHR